MWSDVKPKRNSIFRFLKYKRERGTDNDPRILLEEPSILNFTFRFTGQNIILVINDER